jgi:hypothetical protein
VRLEADCHRIDAESTGFLNSILNTRKTKNPGRGQGFFYGVYLFVALIRSLKMKIPLLFQDDFALLSQEPLLSKLLRSAFQSPLCFHFHL